MIKKILKLSAINTLSAGLNFLSTILIVKSFGLSILGEFTVFNALISLFLLVYIILPPNYSVFKLQDDEEYLQYFNFNYIFVSLLFIPIIFILDILNLSSVDSLLLYFYIVFLAIQNYFDTFFQATNQLKNYFLALFVVSSIRFLGLSYLFLTDGYNFTLNLLLEIYLVPLVLVILALIFMNRETILKIPILNIIQYFNYLKKHFIILRSYYLGTVTKRLKDNSLVLLFSTLVSSEIIGMYTLFVKVGTIVLSQIRVFEAFLMNRSNLVTMESLKSTALIVGFIIQIVLIGIGLLYLKINTDSFHLLSLLIYSFIVYPYLQTILSRTKLLAKYNNSAINTSYFFYLVLIGISFIIANKMQIESLNYILVITILGELLISKTLAFKLRKQYV